MIVVDASAMIELLSGTERGNAVAALLDDDVLAPELLIPEVTRYLARAARAGDDVEPARRAFASAPIAYVPVWPHAERMWDLRDTVSSYDACYVVVAESMQCALVTTDGRLGRAAGIESSVIVVPG